MPPKTQKNTSVAVDPFQNNGKGNSVKNNGSEMARMKAEIERFTAELAVAENALSEAKESAKDWHLFSSLRASK